MFSPNPFGGGSAMGGVDLSPWLQSRGQDIQRGIAAQQMAQEQAQFVAELAAQAERNRQMGTQADAELAAQVRNQDLNRRQQGQIADDEMGLRRTQAEESRTESRRIRDEDFTRDAEARQLSGYAATEAESGGAALMAEGATAEEARATLMRAAQRVAPEKQAAAVEAIENWYAGTAGRGELARKREREDADAEFTGKTRENTLRKMEHDQQTTEDEKAALEAAAEIESYLSARDGELRAGTSAFGEEAGSVAREQVRSDVMARIQAMTSPQAKLAALAAVTRWEDRQYQLVQRDLDEKFRRGQLSEQQRNEAHAVEEEKVWRRNLTNMWDAMSSDGQFGDIITDFYDDGQLTPEHIQRVASNPHLREMLEFAIKMRPPTNEDAQEVADAKKLQKEGAELSVKQQRKNVGYDPDKPSGDQTIKADVPVDPATGKPAELSEDELGDVRELQRISQSKGGLGYVGRAKVRAYEELASLAGATDTDAVNRRALLKKFIELSAGHEQEGLSDLTPDVFDELLVYFAPFTAGASLAVLAGKKGIQGIERLSESERQVAIREVINTLGYGKTAGGITSWLFDMGTGTGPDTDS